MTAKTDFGLHRFSTDDLPERDRVAQWRELCGRTIMKVDMEPQQQLPFRCLAELRRLPDLGIADITTTPNRLTRSRGLIAAGNDDFIFVMATRGEAVISQRNREAMLAPNDAWLIRSDEPSSTEVQSLSRFVSLAIPVATLAPLISNIDTALMPINPGNSTAVRLLVGYLGSLRDDLALADPQMHHLISTHVRDLVALAVGATRDAAEMAQSRGVRAARLRAIKAYVEAHLGQQDLSAETVALSHGISARYVRMLFESESASFSEFVLGQRLAYASRILGDPKFVDRTISAIAYESGFGDLSYFNRAFRRRFGMTPGDMRATRKTENE